jgi:hypothetical protein
MSQDLAPDKAFIFRIVHKDNVGKVFADGCHCRTTMEAKLGYVEIGNQELIERRKNRAVPIKPGGTLSDYVPFYFTPYSPMLYNIKTGWGVPQQSMADILILVSSLPFLRKKGVPFIFTDRHAYLKTAQFSNDLKDLDWIVWSVLQRRDFKKDETDKVEKYQAEALVHKHVPLDALLEIVCYNDSVKALVQAQADGVGAAVKIISKSNWYL